MFACMCLCTTCEPGARRGQVTASDVLELELEMAVNCHLGAGNLLKGKPVTSELSQGIFALFPTLLD